MAEALRETLFYVVPRISPDGAEEVLKQGRYVRSSPVDDRVHKGHAHWESADIDGDGIAGYMRQQSTPTANSSNCAATTASRSTRR